MRIAVTGRHGQVAQSLRERGAIAGIDVVTVARPEIDLTRPADVETALCTMRPDAVVNAAAYTFVDLAESEPALAHQINFLGASAVARAAAKMNIPVVHLSTDYVFDGLLNRPYREDDETDPVGVYGESKREGECAVAAACRDHVILRTAWVYSPFGKNFVRTMLSLARNRAEISVVNDQRGTPTYALDIADAGLAIVQNLVARPTTRELRGIFHMTAGGDTNWAEFAATIFEISASLGGPTARVIPIPTSAYPTPARRPANSRLDNSRLFEVHGLRLPPWRQSVPPCIERLVTQTAQDSPGG